MCVWILMSALDLLAQKGYERTTFTDVALRLKLTKGAVCRHFALKEAMLMVFAENFNQRKKECVK